MSKSVIIVGGMGAAGCVLLSLMMQHLLKVQTEKQRPPVVLQLEEICAEHLVGAVAARQLEIDGDWTLVLSFATKDGIDRKRLGRTVGDLLWRRAGDWGQEVDRLRLEIRAPDGKQPHVIVDSRSPGSDLRTGRMRSKRAAAGEAAPEPAAPTQPPK